MLLYEIYFFYFIISKITFFILDSFIEKNGIEVISKGKKIYDKNGKPITDIDIETKTGKVNTHIGRQLRKYKDYDSEKEAIGMAPNLSEKERKKLNEEGYNVFSRERNLITYLKDKEKKPNMKEVRPDSKIKAKFKKNKKRKK